MTAAAVPSSLVPRLAMAYRRPIVWLVVAVLAAAASVAIILGFSAQPGAQPFAPQHPVVFLGSAAVIAAYGFVFALLVQRCPDNVVGWIFGTFALVIAGSNLSWAYLTYATETIPPQLPAVEVALLLGVTLVPWWTFILVALVVAFPDGRPISPGWGRLIVAAGVVAVVGSLGFVFASGPLPVWMAVSALALPGPSGEVMAIVARLVVVILMVMALGAVWSLILRYRAADDVSRLQLKWLVYAGGVFVACGLMFWLMSGAAYEPGSGASTAAWLLMCFGAIVIPIAASVAILRYHLYDIETIIGRTLVYGGLTAILAGMYTAGIRLFNWVFVELTGESSDAALVLTTLVLATTFTPIKSWLEAKVAARKGVIADPEAAAAVPTSPGSTSAAGVELDDATLERLAELVAARLSASSDGSAGSPGEVAR